VQGGSDGPSFIDYTVTQKPSVPERLLMAHLERELQTELYPARASRTDLWAAGCNVGRGTPAAETTATPHRREVIAYGIAIR
jgi:hypothetical protein